MRIFKISHKAWPLCLIYIGYGMIVGFLATDMANHPRYILSMESLEYAHYQNFALLTGALVGFAIFLLSATSYYIWRKHVRLEWHAFIPLLGSISLIIALFVSAAYGCVFFIFYTACYYIWLRQTQKTEWRELLLFLGITSGISVGFNVSSIVLESAVWFGLSNTSLASVVFINTIATFFGGLLGWLLALFLQSNYDI